MNKLDPYDPRKYKNKRSQYQEKKYSPGSASTTNIKWVYNFEPAKKWALIIFGALSLALSTWQLRDLAIDQMKKEDQKQESETARKEYLTKALEKAKQKAIAEANNKR